MKSIVYIIYSLIILGIAVYSLKKPAFNWDMLPYMGVILSYDHTDAKTIHHDVYTVSKNEVPVTFYNRLTDPSSKYRSSAAQNPEAFYGQLPFYVVKPLYTRMSYLFYKAGASLTMATVWPSAISYFFIGLLLLYWIQKYWSLLFAFMGSLLIMISAPLLSVANLSAPDALSGLLLFTSVYFITERSAPGWAFIFLLLAMLARLDNIIPAIFFLSAVLFSNKWKEKITKARYFTGLAIIFALYFAISFNAYSFGWSLLYYPNFSKQLNAAYAVSSGFIFKDYIALAKSQLMTGLFFSFLSLFLFLTLFLFSGTQIFKFSQLSIEQIFALVFILIILTRFIFQPLIADRIYISYYLSVMVFLVKKYSLVTNIQQSYKR